MSDIENGLIYAEKPQQCDDCGEIEELRPYGPNYSMICFKCMKKDEKGAHRRMSQLMNGDA